MADSLDERINRLYRVKLLQADYEEKRPGSREAQFLAACADMIERRGGVTQRMEGWLEQLLAAGPVRSATGEDIELADRAESAAEGAGVQGEFLRDMAGRLRSGSQLTERQCAATLSLVAQVESDNAPLTPDEIRALDMAHLIERAYSTAYLIERPASFARVRAVISARQQGREVTRSDLNAVLSLFGKLRDVAYPKIHKSDLVYRFDVPMLVVSGPYVSADPYSGVYIEVLTPEGERAAVPLAGVTRRRKNAKA